jgi:hypothetical protein
MASNRRAAVDCQQAALPDIGGCKLVKWQANLSRLVGRYRQIFCVRSIAIRFFR